jgi:hypothetical protein
MSEPILPPLSEHQKSGVTEIHNFDMEQLRLAKIRLEKAQKDVEYWTRNEAASSALGARVMVTGWATRDAKELAEDAEGIIPPQPPKTPKTKPPEPKEAA